ncbi:hypothetical protein AGR5A_Lc80123 [Agrobacterium genomosp. 5 str. CFBP 6626]|nr:hypothetical protein AGR5A_Lc80123 [Agrobacterium genomosp. 5 str. CFBP 6626]
MCQTSGMRSGPGISDQPAVAGQGAGGLELCLKTGSVGEGVSYFRKMHRSLRKPIPVGAPML